jgi:hypothetical protein
MIPVFHEHLTFQRLRCGALLLLVTFLLSLPRWVGGEATSVSPRTNSLPALTAGDAAGMLVPACRDRHDHGSTPGVVAMDRTIHTRGASQEHHTCGLREGGSDLPLVRPATLTIIHSSFL